MIYFIPSIVNLFLLSLVAVTLAQIDDEFYCQAKEDKWSICRRCLETDKKCSQDPEGCHCENIQVADPSQDNRLVGGSDCNDGFCYVSKYIMQKSKYVSGLKLFKIVRTQ